MRVAFVNPNLDGSSVPNLGLAYVMSAVQEGNQLNLLDMSFHRQNYQSYVSQLLGEFKPQVVAFSVTSFNYHDALKIATGIRQEYPNIPLVYGGVHPTLMPEETIKNSLVDAICIGEGEDAFKEYLNYLAQGKSPSQVAGIWYKNPQGEIIRNPLRAYRQDLDSLPFPNWDYWEIERYLKLNESFVGALRIFTSRGCPYSCTFCSNPALRKAIPGTFYRRRSPENIIQEIKINVDKYYEKGLKHIAFGDEIFGLDLVHLEKLSSLYKQENFHKLLTWGCQTRVETITPQWAQIARDSGCVMVGLGIESGDEHIRMNIYKKNFSNARIHEAVNILRKNNIMYCMSILVGCPEDSKKSVMNSFKLVKQTKPIATYFIFYKPLPATELSSNICTDPDYEKASAWRSWNTPKAATKYLSMFSLEMLMIRFSFWRVHHFITQGLSLRGVCFSWDVFKYIFRLDKTRLVSLFSPYIVSEIEAKILYRYVLEDWKKQRLSHAHSFYKS